jgi:hypothetical protein
VAGTEDIHTRYFFDIATLKILISKNLFDFDICPSPQNPGLLSLADKILWRKELSLLFMWNSGL